MNISIKRVYDPSSSKDGTRVLVDRLWPRGVRKVDAHIDVWAKDLTPSAELRSWFHGDPEKRYPDFKKKYAKELSLKKAQAKELLSKKKKITLVTAVKEIERSHMPVLASFLGKIAS